MSPSVRLLLCLVLLAVTPAWAEQSVNPVRGTIAGVPAVNLREQPGTEFRAVAWLREGEHVEVQGIVNGWAQVRTARGETGYVNVTYIAAAEGELDRLRAAATSVQPTAQTGAATPETRATPQTNEDLQAEVIELRAQLEELRRQATHTPEQPALHEIRRDLKAVLEQTSSIERKIGSNPLGGNPIAPMQESPAFPWTLLGIGVFVGAIFGAAVGRRQERRRRTRIRI